MTAQEQEEAQMQADRDFEKIDSLQNKIISAYESIGVIRILKDESDANFRRQEEMLERGIDAWTIEKKGLQDGR